MSNSDTNRYCFGGATDQGYCEDRETQGYACNLPECDAMFLPISVFHIGVVAMSSVSNGCHPPFSPPLQNGLTILLVPVNSCTEAGLLEPCPGVLHSSQSAR